MKVNTGFGKQRERESGGGGGGKGRRDRGGGAYIWENSNFTLLAAENFDLDFLPESTKLVLARIDRRYFQFWPIHLSRDSKEECK